MEPARDWRAFGDMLANDAPMGARRAAAVMVPIAAAASRLDLDDRVDEPMAPDRVQLGADGSVRVDETGARPRRRRSADDEADGAPGGAAGASLGRWFFGLLVGRPPLRRDDAFEPALVDALDRSTCALLARSISDSPGQWPGVEEWSAEFARIAGGLAPPPPPAQRARDRRRRTVAVVALIVLVLVTAAVLVAAPRWWNDLDEGSLSASAPGRSSAAPPRAAAR